MARYTPETWANLFDRKEQALEDSRCVEAINILSFDELEDSLRSIAQEYGHQGFPDIVSRLSPGLNYLKTFQAAISSASQYDPRACLVWGFMQAFVQSAFQHQVVLEDMLSLIDELNLAMPEFGGYLQMLPKSPQLQAHFQDIFDAYMDYCILCIKHMQKSPSIGFFTYLFGSDPARELKRTKEQVQSSMRKFERAAKHSQKQQQFFGSIGEHIMQNPLFQPVNKMEDRTATGIQFPISTVTMPRNKFFQGRNNELQYIRETLYPTSPAPSPMSRPAEQSNFGEDAPCCILQGLGGIGKTQTAHEYTRRHKSDYDAIFWIRADTASSIAAGYAEIAGILGLADTVEVEPNENQGQAIDTVKRWLSSTDKTWLLVFDNVESDDDLNRHLPPSIRTKSAVIITTQKTNVFPSSEKVTTIQIKDLTREQGADLLYACLSGNDASRTPANEEEEECARKISDLLGGLPLALTTIGGYMWETHDSVYDFYEYLKQSCQAWEVSAVGPAKQYDKTLATVFEIALKELSEDARELINLLAFLNPDHIPETLFTDRIGSPTLAFLTSEPRFSETIRVLRNRQLVGRDTSGSPKFLTIHRTVQMAVLHDLSRTPNVRRDAYMRAFALVKSALPNVSSIDNPEPNAWSTFQKYVPHILYIRARCVWPEPSIKLTMDFAQVLSDMATFMWHAGRFSENLDALKTAEQVLNEHNIGIEHHLRGNIHQHIGITASHIGVSMRDECMKRRDLAIEARAASHKLIELNGTVTRDDEIRLWNVQSDMAFGLVHTGDYAKAGVIIESCHEQYKKWGTPDDIPFEYLKYNHIISHTHMAAGRQKEAIFTSQESARLGQMQSGDTHPMTMKCRFTFANHLYFAGMVEESLKENLTILDVRLQTVGEMNPFTLESRSFIGALYAELGELDKAETQFISCLDPHKKTVWDEETYTRAKFLYSDVLRRRGQTAKANQYLQEARNVRDRYLRMYPQWLEVDPDNELGVFDQMVCMWSGRFTGPMKQKLETSASSVMTGTTLQGSKSPLQSAVGSFPIAEEVASLTLQSRQTF
ncbi:hypothetical protein P171DRAFT_519658 [Karstenula rhodostoma CBS 690.94]|uniref:NB-ARC domain-containing protein n=1 Tax=Karstenula rhodostoma CBS 690.94 TaxID=1392251 RepID=A0A9P4UEC2_9PLEO|nr:hypothetical protein P171DRAFT_519658 [Karstenula rhodostoma CBS 690.94]